MRYHGIFVFIVFPSICVYNSIIILKVTKIRPYYSIIMFRITLIKINLRIFINDIYNNAL